MHIKKKLYFQSETIIYVLWSLVFFLFADSIQLSAADNRARGQWQQKKSYNQR